MKKYLVIVLLMAACAFCANAIVVTDDFSANIYAWNEGVIDGDIGEIQRRMDELFFRRP